MATSRDGRRWIVAGVVALVLVVALIVQVLTSPDESGEMPNAAAAAIPPADAVSSAWYCAAGSSAPGGLGDEVLFVTNLSERDAMAEISVMPGSAEPIVVTEVELPALTQTRVRVADVLATPDPGVLVEVFGGRAVVEHGISGDDLAVGACATRAAASWLFGAGTTDVDTELWLALFNPFGDDAIVDLSFLTDTGLETPGEARGLVVPRRSRIMVAVHDLVRRQPVVATQVDVRSGRVVAEQAQSRAAAPAGLALSLGVIEPATQAFFPSVPFEGTNGVSVANPGAAPVQVRVRTHLDGDATLAPEIVVVPSRSAASVDAAARVPEGIGSWVELDARNPFVAEQSLLVDGAGIAYVAAISVTARLWALAEARTGTETQDVVVVVNPSRQAARVTLEIVSGGERTTLEAVTIEPNRRAVFDLGELGVAVGSGLVIRSTRPVAVARQSIGPAGFTATPAIPASSNDS